jgi:molybdopterin converting factor small subunit
MMIHVEFFGVPRHRVGRDAIDVEADNLGETLLQAGRRLPELGFCLEGNRLKAGYLANLNGRTFVSDPTLSLNPGDCVLVLSADVGG